ncbi:LEAF RUST 10 DISEASE-RESISTANCE LOCUS RECEPTOR-LIKE PROTEIN KINASE-like 1.2 isoform X1 [Arachis duranensis]|uniref:non-specific serine/threonine protein kinase n=2 Tax=Arachis TaxID=3817 RepID=A0A6P4DFW4_ARADU|nr:LEAF RUST 10 DISEASE-RESISTANCE LOCUS RECEPTOR-LIKE PROTEIN KINASE-like 1.2 isoform X1 [Arachis duranensis]
MTYSDTSSSTSSISLFLPCSHFDSSQMIQPTLPYILLKFLLRFPLHNHIVILLFLVQIKVTFSATAPNFTACEPVNCGHGPDISYPFYITGKQKPFCGYPGFDLTCGKNGFPILDLINTQHIIQQIFYNNNSLRVSNPVFSTPNTSQCILPTKNLTVGKYRFSIAPNQRNLFVFYGCNLTLLPEEMKEHKIGCSVHSNLSVVALYAEDVTNVRVAEENCRGGWVNATVEDEKRGNVREALEEGFVMSWNASNCSTCLNSGGRCGFDTRPAIYAFRCFCRDGVHVAQCNLPPPPSPPGPQQPEKKRLSKAGKVGIALGVILPSILIIGLLLLFFKRRRSFSRKFQTRNTYADHSSNPDVEGGSVYFGIPLFSYKELEEATSRFDLNKQVGDGGFGTVYYGKLHDGREVAVKRLYEHNYRRVEQFMNEVQILTRLRHKNLVSLYGCTSRTSRELLLVYEYIPNGTVASHLHGESAKPGLLPWSTRMKIAVETASALAYLHATDIIHRDVKTNNILLDYSYCVKVADFGLSRLFPNDVTHVSTAPQGTPGYVDPEYYQCYQLTSKSDVYSFGVVLIELISSKPAVDMNRDKDEINLSNLAIKKIQEGSLVELVDPCLGFDSDNEVKRMVVSVAELAFQCLQRDKELRPSMEKVLEMLLRIESGKHEPEHLEVVDAGHGVSNVNSQQPQPSISPEWDQIVLLKNVKPPSSPITVTDSWESESTTPNVSA